jgi:hypothetical protein
MTVTAITFRGISRCKITVLEMKGASSGASWLSVRQIMCPPLLIKPRQIDALTWSIRAMHGNPVRYPSDVTTPIDASWQLFEAMSIIASTRCSDA